jgi:hypothetical protein
LAGSAAAERSHADESGSSVAPSQPQSARKHTGPRYSTNPFNRLKPSPYRPHVLAKDRVTSWRTPYTFHSLKLLSTSFSPELISRWQDVMVASVDEGTRGNYGAGLLRFNHFCDLHHIAESDRMPASESLLSIFVSSYGAGHVASGTVNSWLAGLQLWCQQSSLAWCGYFEAYEEGSCEARPILFSETASRSSFLQPHVGSSFRPRLVQHPRGRYLGNRLYLLERLR